MILPRKAITVFASGCWIILGLVTVSGADTLFKYEKPVKIGRGAPNGSKIAWTDCHGKNPESFEAPPYALDPADNCDLGPSRFGLRCAGEDCVVDDTTKLEKYLPSIHVYKGERVRLRIDSQSVDIEYKPGATAVESQTLHIER